MNLFQPVRFLFFLAVFTTPNTLVQAEVLNGRPVNILSGESLLLLGADNSKHWVKLIGLNTEPADRPWGSAAKRHLSMLVAGKPVTVKVHLRDQSGTILGKLIIGGLDINLRMIRDGLARHSSAHQSEKERVTYAAAEQQAREAQLGLWKRQNISRRPPVIQLPGRARVRRVP